MKQIRLYLTFFLRLLYLIILAMGSGQAQTIFVENQYFLNPWVYNPARIGESGQMELSLSYKKQWAGVEGAPSIARLGIQVPLKSSLRMGGYIWRQSEGPFRQLEGLFTAAYSLSMSPLDDHYLNFGMSWGFGNRSVNRAELDIPDDPGLNILPSNLSYLQGNFGLHYYYKGLSLGLSVPRLLQDDLTSDGSFSRPTLSFPRYYIFNLGYSFELSRFPIRLEPQLLFHRNADLASSQWEAFFSAYYQERVWAGLSYREGYGTSAYFGAAPTQQIDISYVYSLPSLGAALPQASHELLIRLRLGKAKDRKKEKKRQKLDEPIEEEVLWDDSELMPEENGQMPQDREVKVVDSERSESSLLEETRADSLPPSEKVLWKVEDLNGKAYTLDAGFYLICGAFTYAENAQRFEKMVKAQGKAAKVIRVPERKYYYVYTDYTREEEKAMKSYEELRQKPGFQNTWVLKVD